MWRTTSVIWGDSVKSWVYINHKHFHVLRWYGHLNRHLRVHVPIVLDQEWAVGGLMAFYTEYAKEVVHRSAQVTSSGSWSQQKPRTSELIPSETCSEMEKKSFQVSQQRFECWRVGLNFCLPDDGWKLVIVDNSEQTHSEAGLDIGPRRDRYFQ